jgi:tetratricopeptide (TPR) repeat protein
MTEQTRRNFLKTIMGTAVLAVAGPMLNGCAASLETIVKREEHDTIAHDFLDIEGELGTIYHDYQVLDDIIYEAQKRIKVKSKYTEEEAIDVLETIGEIFKNKGFKSKENLLLNQGLKTKKIDCDNYSVIYLGIADVLNLPLKAVRAPGHVFIRWHFDKDNYINWETTNAKRKSDKEYKSHSKILNIAIKKGVFLRSLSEKEFCSIAYNNRGVTLRKLGKPEEAVKNYDKAIKLDSIYYAAYNNKGVSLDYLERYEEAIENYDKALELYPNYIQAYNNKRIALEKIKKRDAK